MSKSYAVFSKDREAFWEILIILLLILTILFGFWGFWEYESHYHKDLEFWEKTSSSLYHTLQMLILHTSHLDGHAHPAQHIGRMLAAIVFFLATGRVIISVLQFRWAKLKIPFYKGHTVICGLGHLGLSLALQSKTKDWAPVIIENNPENSNIKTVLKKGIPVILGDAKDPVTLRKARVHHAKKLFIVCTRDETNLDIALEAGNLNSGTQLSSSLFIKNPILRNALQKTPMLSGQNEQYSINTKGLEASRVISRKVFAELDLTHLNLPENSGKRPEMIIHGFGEMGQHLACQAACLAHFPSQGLLKIFVVDIEAKQKVDKFRQTFNDIDKIMEIVPIEVLFSGRTTENEIEELYLAGNRSSTLMGLFICYDKDDAFNMSTALEWHRKITLASADNNSDRPKAPILTFLANSVGYYKTLQKLNLSAHTLQLIPFGLLDEIWKLDTLYDEVQDNLAKAYHGVYSGTEVSDREWMSLEETYKTSNRMAADHLRFKLHYLGYKMVPQSESDQSCVKDLQVMLSDKEIKLMLSKIEHARWFAERIIDGWIYGQPRDDTRKIHDKLKSWEELEKDIQKIDEDLMINIPEIIKSTGFGLKCIRK